MLGCVGDMCAMMDFINYKRMPGYEIWLLIGFIYRIIHS